jgi:hypothetical protein
LQNNFPNQRLLDERINHWEILQRQLHQVSDDIYHKVEGAYVAYKIAEIEGKNQLNLLSTELVEEANKALALAKMTEEEVEKGMLGQ